MPGISKTQSKTMRLDKTLFATIVSHTPLLSIDLIVRNSEGKILLGKRRNEPAKGYWFVPGGRVFKDEHLDAAFERIAKEELGIDIKRKEAEFLGVYEHFYNNNVFNDNFSTHYIVLGHKIAIEENITLNDQHDAYRFFTEQELLQDTQVHRYTKDYYRER